MKLWLTTLAIALLAPAGLWAQVPQKTENPEAHKNHASRGSAEEKSEGEKNLLPAELAKKKSPGLGILAAATAAPEKPQPPAAPAKGLLSAGKSSHKLPQHANTLANPWVRHPDDFLVEYELAADAEISVTILDSEDNPIKHFSIPPGAPGGAKGVNSLSYWDGSDSAGREMPLGEYKAQQTIRYAGSSAEPGTPLPSEARVLTLIKR